MTAPTEAEIRAAIDVDEIDFDEAIYGAAAFRAITDSDQALTRRGWAEGFHPVPDHPGTLWADLTDEEDRELREAVEAAADAVIADTRRRLVNGVAAAVLAFAESHPDIPRGRWKSPGNRAA